jgi:hypothetical protein
MPDRDLTVVAREVPEKRKRRVTQPAEKLY